MFMTNQSKEAIMPGTLHHIPIIVQNMKRSLHLFCDVLGFDLVWHLPQVKEPTLATVLCIPDVELELAYLQGGDNQVAIELVSVLGPVNSEPAIIGAEKHGTMSISVKVDNIHEFYERLTAEGWHPYTEIMPIRTPSGEHGRIFCFHTEEGVMVEILEVTKPDAKKISVSTARSET